MREFEEKVAAIIGVLLVGLSLTLVVLLAKENNSLHEMVEFLENCEPIREAEIIGFNDAVVYVYDDEFEHIIEVDIFHELIHCTIEVGDTAVYVVTYDGSDADLLNIIKKP